MSKKADLKRRRNLQYFKNVTEICDENVSLSENKKRHNSRFLLLSRSKNIENLSVMTQTKAPSITNANFQ
ncbi:hypothetical protein CMV37_09715 [Bacillus cereus]|nr:hypothetical protein CMV37_09715 [Bacillus cereus]